MGGFDSIFIIKALLDYNKIHGEYYKIKTFMNNGQVLKLTISIQDKNGKTKSISIRDSYSILNDSLSSLCKKFKLSVLKIFLIILQLNNVYFI